MRARTRSKKYKKSRRRSKNQRGSGIMEQRSRFSLGKWFQQSAYGLTPLMKWAKGDLTDKQINLEDPAVKETVNIQEEKYDRTALIFACRSIQPLSEIRRKVDILIGMGADLTLTAAEDHDDDLSTSGLYKAIDYINRQKDDGTGNLEAIKQAVTPPVTEQPSKPVPSNSA